LLDSVLAPDGATVVTAGGDGVLRFWDVSSGRMTWALPARKAAVNGVHFEGAELVTRSFTGEISRWRIAGPAGSQDPVRNLDRTPALPPAALRRGHGCPGRTASSV